MFCYFDISLVLNSSWSPIGRTWINFDKGNRTCNLLSQGWVVIAETKFSLTDWTRQMSKICMFDCRFNLAINLRIKGVSVYLTLLAQVRHVDKTKKQKQNNQIRSHSTKWSIMPLIRRGSNFFIAELYCSPLDLMPCLPARGMMNCNKGNIVWQRNQTSVLYFQL